jgi:hypothetical protein
MQVPSGNCEEMGGLPVLTAVSTAKSCSPEVVKVQTTMAALLEDEEARLEQALLAPAEGTIFVPGRVCLFGVSQNSAFTS